MGLNPLTNLPVSPKDTPNLLSTTLNPTTSEIRPVEGSYGKYRGINVASDRNFNELRAQNQGTFEILGKSALNTIGGIVIGETISGFGYLLDFPKYAYRALANLGDDITDINREGRESQSFERNAISKFGHAISNLFFDNFEVYQTERAQSGGLNPFSSGSRTRDMTFWGANFPSVFSTVSLMVPAMAASRGLQAVGKLAGMTKGANRATDIIASSFISRHNYNMMEGYDLMDRQLQKYQEEGYDFNKAKELAAADASRFYSVGYLNMWKDITQWGMITKGFKYANQNVTRDTAKVLEGGSDAISKTISETLKRGRSIGEAMKASPFNRLDILKQAGLEAIEEFNIQFQKNWSARNADIIHGLEVGDLTNFFESYFSSDVISELGNIDTQNAMLMAFLGGPVIAGATKAITYAENKKAITQQAAIAEQTRQELTNIQRQYKEYQSLLAQGNEVGAKKILQEDLINQAVRALHTSTMEHIMDMYEAITKLSPAEITELELGASAKENASWALNELKQITDIYESHANNAFKSDIKQIVDVYLTEQDYLIKKSEEAISDSNNELSGVYNSVKDTIDTKGLSTSNLTAYARKAALEKYKKAREQFSEVLKRGANPLRYQMLERRYKETTAWLDSELETKVDTISDERTFYNTVLAKNDTFMDAIDRIVSNEIAIREGKANMTEYIEPNFASEFKAVKSMNDERINSLVNSYMFKKHLPDDSVVRHDGKTYIVEHSDTGSTLKEFDTSTSQLTGESIPLTGDIWNESVVGKAIVSKENLITPQQKEELTKELEKNLDDLDYKKYLENTSKLWISGYEKEATAARTNLVKNFKEWVEKSNSPRDIIENANLLASVIQSDSLKKELLAIAKKQSDELMAKYNQEKKTIEDSLAPTIKKLEEIETAITDIDNQVAKAKEAVVEYNSENKIVELEQARKEVDTQLQQELVQLGSQITAEQTKDIFTKYDNILKDKVEVILKRDSEAAKLAKDTLDNYKKVKAEIQTKKTELEKTKKQYLQSKRVYDSLLEKYLQEYQKNKDTNILIMAEQLEAQVANRELKNTVMDFPDLFSEEVYQRLENVSDNLDGLLSVVNDFIKYLEDLVGVNTVLKQAMVNAYLRLLRQYKTPQDIPTTESFLNQYKQILFSEISRLSPSAILTTQQLRALNIARKELQSETNLAKIQYRDVITPKAFEQLLETPIKEFKEAFKNTKQQKAIKDKIVDDAIEETLITLRHFQKKVIQRIQKKINVIKHNLPKEEEKLFEEGDKDKPLKKLQHVYPTHAGNTTANMANYRYTQFVTQTNPKGLASKIVKPSSVGIEIKIDEKVAERTKEGTYNDQEILYYLVGKYEDGVFKYATQQKDGSFIYSETFNPETSVYAPVVGKDTAIQYLDKGEKPEIEALYQQKHAEWIDSVLSDLAEGKEVFVSNTVKSIGIIDPSWLMDEAYSYTKKNGNNNIPNKLAKVLNTPFEIYVSTTGVIEIDEMSYSLPKGRVAAYVPETGNIFEVVSRRLTKEEVDVIYHWLEEYAKNITFNEKNGKPNFNKEQFNVDGITISDLIEFKSNFLSDILFDIKLAENSIEYTIDGKKQSIQLLAKDNTGNLKKELFSPTELKSFISGLLTNINNAKYVKEDAKYIPITLKDGKLVKDTKPQSYQEFVLDSLANTWLKEDYTKQTIKVEGTEQPAPAFLNQQLRIEHPTISGLTIPKETVNKKQDKPIAKKSEKTKVVDGFEVASTTIEGAPTLAEAKNLLKEYEASKKQQQPIVKQEPVKKETSIRTSENTGTTKYFQIAPTETITSKYIVDKPKDSEHFFKLEYNENTGKGVVSYRHNEYDMQAVNTYDTYLEGLFEITNKEDFPHNVYPDGLKMITPATVKKDGNNWVLVEKGEIRLTPDKTPEVKQEITVEKETKTVNINPNLLKKETKPELIAYIAYLLNENQLIGEEKNTPKVILEEVSKLDENNIFDKIVYLEIKLHGIESGQENIKEEWGDSNDPGNMYAEMEKNEADFVPEMSSFEKLKQKAEILLESFLKGEVTATVETTTEVTQETTEPAKSSLFAELAALDIPTDIQSDTMLFDDTSENAPASNFANIVNSEGVPISELGFTQEEWYLKTQEERDNIIKCNYKK